MSKNKIELGICQISILSDFLTILKKDDYKILKENGYKTEVKNGYAKEWVDDLLNNFCKPLIEHDEDVTITLEDK